LNDLLYMNGEVVKLFLAPRGPDSQWDFYTLNGGRRNYYDTSATSHALAEDCYIVRPLAPGENPAPNGLPVFPLYYENDDDSENSKGSDSRVTFTAPETGKYLVRISDTRGWQGPRFSYALTVREARPDFNVRISPDSLTVRPGTGQSFTVTRERTDGFEGEIEVVIENLPEGWIVSSPLIIEAGHERATGTLFATDGSVEPDEEAWKSVRVRASAKVGNSSGQTAGAGPRAGADGFHLHGNLSGTIGCTRDHRSSGRNRSGMDPGNPTGAQGSCDVFRRESAAWGDRR
jgi:hypothetical protein